MLVAGALRAKLPGDTFSVAWTHSVEKTRWEERYRVEPASLVLVEARVEGSGAGMEAGPGARLVDGAWTWTPSSPPLPELRLTHSPYTADYTVCAARDCRTLGAWAGLGPTAIDVVTVRPCAR
ncbi:MAG: DUF1850 domain-containing protein [Proteobacteria bacterium]|nr:DUF1850 domain-containing protein [Pseudomonadota bacterium]